MSLVEYFDWAIVEGNAPEMGSYQSWFLTGYDDERSREVIEDLTRRRLLMIFPLSSFDQMLLYLQTAFPKEFRDCRYRIKNEGWTRRKADLSLLESCRDAMKEHGATDYWLLELADRQLSRLLEENVGPGSEVDRRVAELRKANRSSSYLASRIRARLRRRLIRVANRL